jgi:hypothetical protein
MSQTTKPRLIPSMIEFVNFQMRSIFARMRSKKVPAILSQPMEPTEPIVIRQVRETPRQISRKPMLTWYYRGLETQAHTKSEARAHFKRKLHLRRLPVGAKVVKSN